MNANLGRRDFGALHLPYAVQALLQQDTGVCVFKFGYDTLNSSVARCDSGVTYALGESHVNLVRRSVDQLLVCLSTHCRLSGEHGLLELRHL